MSAENPAEQQTASPAAPPTLTLIGATDVDLCIDGSCEVNPPAR